MVRSPPIFLGSRVAQRVFWLFVLCALLPLALSDWLATSAIAELARNLEQRSQIQSTRQTALKVFDRLATAKAALLALGDRPPSTESEALTSVDHIFRTLVRVDATAQQVALAGNSGELVAAWNRSGHHAGEAVPSKAAAGRDIVVTIRIAVAADGVSRVLMGTTGPAGVGWISELRPTFLWEPLDEAAIDGAWIVTDETERVLARRGESELSNGTQGRGQAQDPKLQVYHTSLS